MSHVLTSYLTGVVLVLLYTKGSLTNRVVTALTWPVFIPVITVCSFLR